jgi:amino acid adenylation domain-containing protein
MPPRTLEAAQPPAAFVAAEQRGLHSGFLRSAEAFAERPALQVADQTLTYSELRELAASVAATLAREAPAADPPLTAIFAYRTPAAFAGVLGALMRGHGYVPLNPTLPPARNRLMLERSGCRAIVADAASAPLLAEVLDGIERSLLVVAVDMLDPRSLAARLPGHAVLGAGELEPAGSWRPAPTDPSEVAYVLFTSGSTGIPKGVTVAHRNVTWLIDVMVDRYAISERDRVSQTHELTFDVSVWDMFVTWERGACLCCPSRKELINPGRFIVDTELSVWFSVPSTAIFMKRLGMLKPGSYPQLRFGLFAGEPMPVAVAEAWLEAAPASRVENLYGPTELTVVCLEYVWDPQRSPDECEAGVIPIGWPLPGMSALVVDEQLREVAPGSCGELLMAGPQVTLGYWRDPERTAAAFVAPPGMDRVHYRTGDRVRRPASPERPMTYLGRLDHQIKVRGVRVELGEVEAAVREATQVDAVVAVGWPLTATGADGVVAFVGAEHVDAQETLARLRARLPVQMVPRQLHLLPELPLNASGKFDRKALIETLGEAS